MELPPLVFETSLYAIPAPRLHVLSLKFQDTRDKEQKIFKNQKLNFQTVEH